MSPFGAHKGGDGFLSAPLSITRVERTFHLGGAGAWDHRSPARAWSGAIESLFSFLTKPTMELSGSTILET